MISELMDLVTRWRDNAVKLDEKQKVMTANVHRLFANELEVAIRKTWKPIETAPKDGTTWIIVCCEGRDEILIAYWHRLLKCWCGQSGHNGSFVKWKEKDVTHWRHIPKPVGVK